MEDLEETAKLLWGQRHPNVSYQEQLRRLITELDIDYPGERVRNEEREHAVRDGHEQHDY